LPCEATGVRVPIAVLSVLVSAAVAAGYEADLVPATRRPEARDLSGTIAIRGADGAVSVTIANVNDAHGDPLDGTLLVELGLRVNGIRRRVSIPLTLDTGDGTASASLGLDAGDAMVIQGVRVRAPDHHTLALAGALTVAAAPPAPAPPPSDCPSALEQCQSDLADCNEELDACESP
jgi:hypothetical protein